MNILKNSKSQLFVSFLRTLIVLLSLVIFTTFVYENHISDYPVKFTNNPFPASYLNESITALSQFYDSRLLAMVADNVTPGAAMAIVYNGEIILLKAYGCKKQGTLDSVDIHTVFRIGSVSKGFASALTSILASENIIHLDDRIKYYLPDFHHFDTSNFNKITIKNLLSHTTGFPVHTFTDLLDCNMPYSNIHRQLNTVPFVTRPGEVYSYQNVAFSLISDIMYNVTGKEYVYLLREKIFIPLNMKDASSEYVSLIMSGNYAFPHIKHRNTWVPVNNNTRYYATAPASGINASIADMAQWLLAVTGTREDIINHAILDSIFKPQVEIPLRRRLKKAWPEAENFYYGLGWRIVQTKNKTLIFHGGHVQGFHAEIGFSPDDKIGIVILCNANAPDAGYLIPEFFRHIYLSGLS
jgi:beta-lactamase class C